MTLTATAFATESWPPTRFPATALGFCCDALNVGQTAIAQRRKAPLQRSCIKWSRFGTETAKSAIQFPAWKEIYFRPPLPDRFWDIRFTLTLNTRHPFLVYRPKRKADILFHLIRMSIMHSALTLRPLHYS